MAKPILPAVREQAATLLAISASQPPGMGLEYVADCIGASSDAVSLAYDAWIAVGGGLVDRGCWERDADAEAMLRCGWEPSDG